MMNRTLTAAVALAVGLGMAGLAYAQGSSSTAIPPSNSGSSSTGVQTAPATPGMTSPSPSATAPTTGASQMPQANAASGSISGGQAEMSTRNIEEAQQQLKSQGLYNGRIDGIAGPETKSALSQFQRQQGLPATAMLDQQTMERLMSRGGQGENSAPQTTPMTRSPAPQGATQPGNQQNRY